MSTKTISITEEAYKRLASLKKENESFSRVINRITSKRKLIEFAGILSKESAEELEDNIRKFRRKDQEMYDNKIKKIENTLG